MSSLDALARRLRAVEKQVRATNTPRLANSTIEDGALRERDRDGNLRGQFGLHFDGTHAPLSMGGPAPPAPTAPTLIPAAGGFWLVWDGNFADYAAAPMDFARVEAHVDTTDTLLAVAADCLRATIETPRGGRVFIPIVDDHDLPRYARLVSRTLSGGTSVAGVVSESVFSGPVKLFTQDEEGNPYEVVRLGSEGSDDFISVPNAAGQVVASISSLGSASFRDMSTTNWPQVGAGDWTGLGGSLDEILDRRPRSLPGYALLTVAGPGTLTETGWQEFGITLHPGRSYRLSGAVRLKSTVAADVAQVQVRYATAQPSLTSPLLLRASTEVNTVARSVPLGSVFSLADLGLTTSSALRFLVCYSRVSGTGTVSADASADEPGRLVVEDLGPAPRLVATVVNDGGGAAVVVLPPTSRTLTVIGSWTNSYAGDGVHSVSPTNAWQGYLALHGMRKSMIGFPELTQLAGATVTGVTLRLHAKNWGAEASAGGTAVVGFHSYLAKPSGPLTELISYTADVNRTGVWSGRGVGYVDLTANAPQEWVTGVKRGIYLGLAQGMSDQSDQISGAFAGALDSDIATRPELTITYMN